MTRIGSHAVVLGGSMAGVLAARVLAERYELVTIVDRDRLTATAGYRRGVPQDRHVHALLPRGKRIIDDLFPGATEELVARGALLGRMSRDATVFMSGARLCKVDAGLEMLSVSRPLLEGYLRSRLLDLPNVTALEACDVHGLTTDETDATVTGVRILRRADNSAEERLSSDLVVDATGRSSRASVWLRNLGYSPPPEEKVDIRLTYTTGIYPRYADDTEHQIIVGHPRGGAAIAIEEDRYVVTLAGMGGDAAPTDLMGFEAYASTLPIPEMHELIRDREPLEDPVLMRYPASCRRRYEALSRFPEGFVVTGDALCSFNPVYGQGMSVAALEALKLGRCVDAGEERIGPRFFDAIQKTVDVAWDMAAGADAQHQVGDTSPPLKVRLANSYLEKLACVAQHDPVVATAFLKVVALVAHPRTLLGPRIALRVLALSSRKAGPPAAPAAGRSPRMSSSQAR